MSTYENAAECSDECAGIEPKWTFKVMDFDITSCLKLYFKVAFLILVASVLTGYFGNFTVGSVSSDVVIALSHASALAIVALPVSFIVVFAFALLIGAVEASTSDDVEVTVEPAV
jgi:hypothetical protein